MDYIKTFKYDYEKYTRIEHIWYYDGSLLDHMLDRYGNDVLILWNDYKKYGNSWIASILKKDEIDKFRSKEIDLRDAMINAVCNIYFELNKNIDVLNEREINVIDNPEYFPESGCYYD